LLVAEAAVQAQAETIINPLVVVALVVTAHFLAFL
jgi:hypothetical protein